jgi:hypothetical protein
MKIWGEGERTGALRVGPGDIEVRVGHFLVGRRCE